MRAVTRDLKPDLWRLRKSIVLGPLHPLFGVGRVAPSFLIVGGQRCGTTALARYLTNHPAISISWRKEVDYFSVHYGKGERWYLAHFPSRLSVARARHGGESAAFDASPSYLPHPMAPQRVAAFDPAMKLIALLRDPVERAFSHYRREVSLGRENLSFSAALDAEDDRLAEARSRCHDDPDAFHRSHAFLRHSYATRGRYLEQLLPWEDRFPQDQLLVLASEDLFTRPAETLELVCSFVGVSPPPPADYPVFNAAPAAELDADVRRRLVTEFAEPNARLYEHLGRDLGWQR